MWGGVSPLFGAGPSPRPGLFRDFPCRSAYKADQEEQREDRQKQFKKTSWVHANVVTLPSSHRPPRLSGQAPLLSVDFGSIFGRFCSFSTVFAQFWSKTAKINSKSAPFEGVALGAWRREWGLWLEVRSQR